MKTVKKTHYALYVLRGKFAIPFSANEYDSVESARTAARRLGEYAEIRRVDSVVVTTLAERVEHVA